LIVHVPVPTSETVEPETVQTPALVRSVEKATGRPELAVAETVYEEPMTAPPGAVELKLIDCTLSEGVVTENDCCTCTAGWNAPFPPWSALTVHVPDPTNDTVAPETLHTPALVASAENATANPELAVADTVDAEPPTTAPPGGKVVKLIVWGFLPTDNDCCTCGAGR
jgi:hypothetical protein